MIELVKTNWAKALAEVCASIGGTLGVVFVIALIVSEQGNNLTASASFAQYFHGGQISLPILSLSGIILVALLRKHGTLHPMLALVVYIVFCGPIVAATFIIGLNPGFRADVLSPSNLFYLWCSYWVLHALWFLVLALEPAVPSAQAAAKAQEGRVNQIKAGAAGRA